MALQRGRARESPPDSIMLTKEEAQEYQYKIIYGWKPERDVWPFRHGYGILAGSSALAGIYINSYYRSRLRLQTYGRMSSYLPIVVLPAMMTAIFHQQAVSNDIMVQKTVCPLCLELRASAIQVGFSVIYPSILSPLAGFMLASHYNTYKLPLFTEDPKAVFRVWKKLSRGVGNTLFSICIAQTLIAMWITYSEAKAYYKIQAILNMESDDTEELSG